MPNSVLPKGKKLLRIRPRGFCAGVVRAVDIVQLAVEAYGPPVYVHHEIVHNRYVVEQLRRRGAIFVESVEDVPIGAVLIFSAHGVPPTVREEAHLRKLRVIDATCPLVTKVHLEALRFAREGRTIILIGHKDHQEIVGTSGEAPEQTVVVDSVEAVNRLVVDDPTRLAYLTQTTLSLYDTNEIVIRLRERFPQIAGPASDGPVLAWGLLGPPTEAQSALLHQVARFELHNARIPVTLVLQSVRRSSARGVTATTPAAPAGRRRPAGRLWRDEPSPRGTLPARAGAHSRGRRSR